MQRRDFMDILQKADELMFMGWIKDGYTIIVRTFMMLYLKKIYTLRNSFFFITLSKPKLFGIWNCV